MERLRKKVDLECRGRFRIGPTLFGGNYHNIILDTEAIRIALINKAVVKEILKNGKRLNLTFSNYNKKSPMSIDLNAPQEPIQTPVVKEEPKVETKQTTPTAPKKTETKTKTAPELPAVQANKIEVVSPNANIKDIITTDKK